MKQRLVEAVQKKIRAARLGYDTSLPLILSVYVSEYIAIYLRVSDLEELVRGHGSVFEDIAPLSELVFWNLPNDEVFSVGYK